LEEVQKGTYDCFLACPSYLTSHYKTLYDERIHILHKVLGQRVFPGYDAIMLHENKRLLAYWLQANNLPHPETHIFYSKDEAEAFAARAELPIVVKSNIGASGKGVKIFKNRRAAFVYINKVFSKKGVRQKIGPNLKMGDTWRRLKNFIKNAEHRKSRLREYKSIYKDPQRYFVIFQEYVPHDYEWRVVRIGESYFGHQKTKVGDKASGTKGIDYIEPPEKLLNFVKDLCEKYGFYSMAVDLFEGGDSGYLINELQTVFGHVQAFILERDGKPGRYRFSNNKWEFEEGMYNTNLSYDLRLETAIRLLESASGGQGALFAPMLGDPYVRLKC
jgi:glutathione synthase/RimK-type ligase-like ATP-grasp enzyme